MATQAIIHLLFSPSLPENVWKFSYTFAIHLALHFPFDSDSGMSTD